MKPRTKKIFITLIALFIAGLATVNAYDYNVINRNPFGSLKLQNLSIKALKNDGNRGTGIILSGNLIQVNDFGLGRTTQGQINVSRICDANGGNCKQVSLLGNGDGSEDGTQGGDPFRTTEYKHIYDEGFGRLSEDEQTVITPSRLNHFFFFSGYNFYNEGAFRFFTMQGDGGLASSRVIMDAKGLRIGNGGQFYTGAGLAVGGTIVAGNTSTDNFIYIYASGNHDNPEKHHEIIGSKELAIGTRSGAYLYFHNTDGNGNERYSIGINHTGAQATLDVNGTIKIASNCAGKDNIGVVATCDNITAGTIMYINNRFVGCMKNGTNRGRFDFISGEETGNQNNQITTICGYQGFLTPSAIIYDPIETNDGIS